MSGLRGRAAAAWRALRVGFEPERVDVPGAPFTTWVPPGHFYSIVPSAQDAERARSRSLSAPRELAAIPLDDESMVADFTMRAALVRDWDGGVPGRDRYQPRNGQFDRGDALMLRAAILLARPSRIVEVGSGWSTACILDTLDDARLATQVTCVEPYPQVLRERLRVPDRDRVRVLQQPLQTVSLEEFTTLGPDDILFIDSSHVFKPGSDVDDYFGRILPVLRPGVIVHIHDIFWPFEVPPEWLDEGRAWNEAHALRNFLTGNTGWKIRVFSHWFQQYHEDVVERDLPAMMETKCGSVWLERVAPG